MRFSIITVCFNSSHTIRDTILSVLNQTMSPFEYIIIDGKSTDGTLDIIEEFKHIFENKKIPLRVFSESDKGLYDAMNKGIGMASGDVIGIINSDDWYEPKAIEYANREFEQRKSISIVHGLVRRIRHDGYSYLMAGKNIKRLRYYMCLNHPTFMVKKSVYDRIGAFDLQYKLSADYDFTLRAYLSGFEFYKVEKIMANMRLGGISELRYKEGLKEKRIIQKKNGFSFYVYSLSYIAFEIKHRIINFLVKRNINYQKFIKKKI
ncbi:Glycosyl transferase family 2 [Prevotella sp. tc2-28]|uniref:glycosyltransferase family 2 protein n=1 Tax=Prevotella sp. tc2-28 TaxID=1761888 RepID=UPI00089B0215|nr:glycosyltransferase family 2 protein [Prevotella sp. tc2-28]SEA09466.1 Glycosyl transferase family 2 [Prevotella sp. tc2-28]